MSHSDHLYGICNLSVVPVRTQPAEKAEIGTQLLFGDTFIILKKSEDLKWLFIENAFDNYVGWIDFKQYQPISKDYFEIITGSESMLCKELIGLIRGELIFFPVLFGTPLPFYKDGIVVLENEVYNFEGQVQETKKSTNFKFLEKTAITYLNTPYMWGGKTHFGIDCSGFVQQVFRFSGYYLPRDAYQQAEIGASVSFIEHRAGDLAFFKNDSGLVSHVGIILENGQIIHASGRVRIDVFDETGIYNIERSLYSHQLSSIRRVLA